MTIREGGGGEKGDSAFDLAIRTKLARYTFQSPDDIASGIRMISSIELWNEIAREIVLPDTSAKPDAKRIKRELNQIVDRRNKIVHEGDLQPGSPRAAWPINRDDVNHVTTTILGIVTAIENVINK
jgi:hypothetical protein